jgi:hypothetical protein
MMLCMFVRFACVLVLVCACECVGFVLFVAVCGYCGCKIYA